MPTFSKNSKLMNCLLFVLLSLVHIKSISASDNEQSKEWRYTYGGGAYTLPEFEGADKNMSLIFPVVDIAYKDKFFFNFFDGIGTYLYKDDKFELKTSLWYDFGREVDDDLRLVGTGDIEDGVTGQIKFEIDFDLVQPYVGIKKMFSGTEGIKTEIGLEFTHRFTDSFTSPMLITTVFAEYSDSAHMKGYFGISDSQSLTSSYVVYDPEPGISSSGLTISYIHPLEGRWAIVSNLKWSEFQNGAELSPLVFDAEHLRGGIFMTYTF